MIPPQNVPVPRRALEMLVVGEFLSSHVLLISLLFEVAEKSFMVVSGGNAVAIINVFRVNRGGCIVAFEQEFFTSKRECA